MPKKTLVLALCVALCAMMFAGCWGSSSSSSSMSSSKPSSSMSTAPSTSDSMTSSMPESAGSGSMSGSGATDGAGSSSASTSSTTSTTTSATTQAAAPAAAAGETVWALRLVNAQNPLPEGFSVETRSIKGYENRQFDARAADALEQMLHDAQQAGNQLYLVSAYRSVARQKALFQRKTNAFLAEGFPQAEAEKQAAMWVARPGTSEHNLGLAADIVSADWYKTHNDLTADFETTPQFAWLKEHCAAYGFVIRYPKGKENVTGVTYEPWHYRYVGMEAAVEISKTGATLEEYLQKTGKTT